MFFFPTYLYRRTSVQSETLHSKNIALEEADETNNITADIRISYLLAPVITQGLLESLVRVMLLASCGT